MATADTKSTPVITERASFRTWACRSETEMIPRDFQPVLGEVV